MFVVVFLSGPKKLTVIPEEFIFELNEKKLKNFGCNSNQAYRIYFSKEWFLNQVHEINLGKIFISNFNLPVSDVHPLPNDIVAAVFKAHLRKFEVKRQCHFFLNLFFTFTNFI